jgi:hypothetical protein
MVLITHILATENLNLKSEFKYLENGEVDFRSKFHHQAIFETESETETDRVQKDGLKCRLHANIHFPTVAPILREISDFKNLTYLVTP